MADYGADEGGYPLSALEATGDATSRQQRRLNQADLSDLLVFGAELERRRAELKAWCDANGWEFVGEVSVGEVGDAIA